MDYVDLAIHLGVLVAILVFPMHVAARNYVAEGNVGLLRTNLMSMPVIFALALILAFWGPFYADVRLELMGFDFSQNSDSSRARNVAPELKELATKLYWSNMGVGWSLRAMFWMVLIAPYPSIASVLVATVHYIKCKVAK